MYTLALMVTSAAIGGTLQYGYNLAIMNAPTVVRTSVSSGLSERGEIVAFYFCHIICLCVSVKANYKFCVLCSFLQFIQKFVNETFQERWGIQLGVYEVTLIWTFIVSIFSLGGFTGALIAGPMSVRFGRYNHFCLYLVVFTVTVYMFLMFLTNCFI